MCLLLRAKYLDEKEKQKAKNTNFPENTNIGRVHPSPAELREPSASFTTTAKCDPKTLKVGYSAVTGKRFEKSGRAR